MSEKWFDMEWIECSYMTTDDKWHDMDSNTAKHIIRCVNEHDKLVAENERLKEALKQIQHDIDGAECRDDLDGIKGYIDEIIKDGEE